MIVRSTFSALESRLMSRWDVQKYAREAFDMGIRYIGACCGFEPYHVRAIAEEVQKKITLCNLPSNLIFIKVLSWAFEYVGLKCFTRRE